MIRIDTLWLCTQPQDMRAGADRLLNGRRQHHRRGAGAPRLPLRQPARHRIKLLVHDGFGVWCATRRLHTGRFVWLDRESGEAAMAAACS
jgi:transposase